ncbi:oligopeptide ABC transporter permease [Bacillus massiliigorillae]|uniref:oligopeptide ABC transporter permease n=1 Tax=Bacillus massiliigorillae TaxID=1243664 RepID=UPI0005AAEA8E
MKSQSNSSLEYKRRMKQSPWSIARQKFTRNIIAMSSMIIFVFIVGISLFAEPLSKPLVETEEIHLEQMSQAPSAHYILGTDQSGREVWPRLLHAGHTSLNIAFSITLLAITIGTIIGAIAGYYGGMVDYLLMRFTDFVMVFPFIVLVIVVKSIFVDTGIGTFILVVGLLSWTGTARVVRSKVMAEKENEYVMSAISIGCGSLNVIIKHILPNILSTIIVKATLLVATMIVAETGLSYLGFGVPMNIPTWGNMVQEARSPDVLANKWWIWMPPAVMLTLTILCINFIGEGLKDAFNPKSSK